MDKQQAIDLLGGSVTTAAAEVGVSPAAVTQWPEILPSRISDRVQAALWRRSQAAIPSAPDVLALTTEASHAA